MEKLHLDILDQEKEKIFLAQLLYTQDISRAEIEGTQMIESATLSEVATFFEKEVDAYLKRKL